MRRSKRLLHLRIAGYFLTSHHFAVSYYYVTYNLSLVFYLGACLKPVTHLPREETTPKRTPHSDKVEDDHLIT